MSYKTVRGLLREEYKEEVDQEEDYFACLDKDCQTAYFTEKKDYDLSKLEKSLYYKDDGQEKIVCYCNNVSEADIFKAMEAGADNLKDLISLTGVMKNSNCIEKNPLGG